MMQAVALVLFVAMYDAYRDSCRCATTSYVPVHTKRFSPQEWCCSIDVATC